MNPEIRSALLLVVADEFRKGRITEMHLEGDTSIYDGVCEHTGHIYVDPVPGILDTATHEVLHRRFPKWSEKRVSDTAARLVYGMTAPERRLLYALYRRVAKKRRGVRKVDE